MKNEKKINYHGINTISMIYNGIQIIRNPLSGNWMLFFRKDGKFFDQPPFCGKLNDMKRIIRFAIKENKGAENEFICESTY